VIPIISIVGKSDSGKTTLIEKLVPELTRRGTGLLRSSTMSMDLKWIGKGRIAGDISKQGRIP